MAAWYSTAWRYRALLQTDYTKVVTTQANFPAYLSGVNVPAGLFTGALASGNDLLFTLADGQTKIPHDMPHFVPGSSALEAHLLIASLSSAANTPVYAYWGNPDATDQRNSAAVWSNGYVAVYHLGESAAGTGTVGLYRDSAGTNHGDDYVDPGGKAGQLFATGGETFTTDDYVTIPDLLNGATAATVQAWVKRTTYVQYAGFVENYQSGALYRRFLLGYENPSGTISAYFASRDVLKSAGKTGFPNNQWAHVCGTYVGGGNVIAYINGVGGTPTTGAPTALNTNVVPEGHRRMGFYGTAYLNGKLDEVRISSVARSAPWIATEYANQSAPNTFWQTGAVEYAPVFYAINPASARGNLGARSIIGRTP